MGFLIILSLSGCFKRDNMEDITIYTTIYPLNYITDYLYGDNAKIYSVYPSGVDVTTYELTNKQIEDYSNNDLFVFNSLDRDRDYAVKMINKNKNLKIIDVALGMETINSIEELWLNPYNYLMMAQNLKNGLNEYIENPLLDYNENSNLPSWNQYVSYSSAKEDEDIYKEIPDFSENGIKEFLLDQLNQRNFSDLQWTAMQTMIDCLDDCGYFKLSLKDFSQWFGIDISTVKYCLDILSSLEPLGIFSKDLPHCLLRQLEARQELTPELNQIIRYHLDDIAAGKINTITQKLSMSTQDVRKCIAKIRELNPRPISGFLTNSTDYIVPDILIDYQDSSWIIRLNDQWIGNYSLCDYYLNMMHTSQSPELKEYFRKKYNPRISIGNHRKNH